MAFVLDSSVALAMLLPDERSEAADRMAEALLRSSAHVPAIWPLEVRNALLVAHRARRITPREFEERLGIVDELPVEIDGGHRAEALSRSVEIARRHGLSVYDASYLELAERALLPLATFDARLLRVGAALRIPSVS